jgi:hypothetical protein
METESIFSKCMLLVLSIHAAGDARKITKDKLSIVKTEGQTDPEEKSWNAAKKLFGSSAEYKAIIQLDNQIRAQLEKLELPAQFQRGTFAIPLKSVPEVQKMVQAYLVERAKLVEVFLDKYLTIIGEQQVVLGPLFDITDYPEPKEIKRRFYVRHKWLALGVPEQLKNVSEELYNDQVKAQQEELANVFEEVRDGLRGALKGLVDHLLNRLSRKNEKGEVLRLRSSAVDNIVEFLDMLPNKNVTGDVQIQLLAEKARAIVTAVDVETIKKDGLRRSIVEKRLGEISTELDKLVEAKPIRKMGGFGEVSP